MRIAEFSARRPVFITMIACIVIVLGGIALRYLPVDLFPEIDFPAVSITATYDDASPEEVEELITRPIERGVSAVTGIENITSTSSEETSNVVIEFTWGADLEEAVSDVRDRIDRVMKKLPDDVDRPILRRFDSAAMPIMRLGVSTPLDLQKAQKKLEDSVQYRLERIPGVASADVAGGYEREIHVLLDVGKARMLGIALDSLLLRISDANVTTPAGNLKEGRMEIRLRTPGTFESLDEIRDLVIHTSADGSQLRLSDVAEVIDTHEDVTRHVRVNGQPGIFIAIYKQSGANTVAVARGVKKELEKINAEMAHEFHVVPMMDSSEFIERSIRNVSDTAVSGGLLAVLVLLFFLCDLRSTLIIAISIPLSIVATFALIYFCGFSLNVMTLGGLALGIGMLVDNSIVVLENVTRLHDQGVPALEASIRGTSEVGSALVASTLTTVAVFLPMLFMQGLAGVMFRQLAVVVAFSLSCSLIAAVTLVPMLSAQLIRDPAPGEKDQPASWRQKLYAYSQRCFQTMDNGYAAFLDLVMRHRRLTIGITVALLIACSFLGPLIGTELMPKSDEGIIRITLEEAVGTGSGFVNETVIATEPIIQKESEGLRYWMSAAGSSGWRATGSHKASYQIRLESRTKRRQSSEEIAARLDKVLNRLPGTVFRVRSSTPFMMGGGSGESVKIDVRGYDFETAEALGKRVAEIVAGVRGVTDTQLSRDLGMPERRIRIDRRKAADMNVSVRTIAEALRTILAGSEAGNYRERGDEYAILVKLKDGEYLSSEELLDMTVQNEEGDPVVLRNLLSTGDTLGPVTIERKNQERVLTVSANLFERDLGSAIAEIREKLKVLEPLPGDFTISFAGDYEDQQETFQELGFALVLALLLVYMVMACQFESYKDPLVVMFSVPLAAIGVLLALFLTETTLNMQSLIGCIMLAGIVVNNAILLVDTAHLIRRDEGVADVRQAVREAGRRRLRPILMTTLTTVLGLIPLALGWGDGGETQAPLARAVIGGLTSSTLITLFFIPAVYSLTEEWKEKRAARRKKNHA